MPIQKIKKLFATLRPSPKEDVRVVEVPEKMIGRLEYVRIPSSSGASPQVTAKIDTGAYNSSIHAENIHLKNDILYCQIMGENYEFDSFLIKKVKSSNGTYQERYLVDLSIFIGKQAYDIKVTLADRLVMRREMLIGRKFLRKNRFIVNARKKYVIHKEERAKK